MNHARTWTVAGVCLAVLATGCAVAPATLDPLSTIGTIREAGCQGRHGARMALRRDARLDRVATRLALGGELAATIDAERYPAARSTLIHIEQAANEPAVTRLLETQFCAEITDDAFEAIGAESHGGQTWIVLAAPFRAPQVTDTRAMASRVLELVNAGRSQPRLCGARTFAAAGALTLDPTLGRVADAHARDMARHSSMSHTGSDGSTPAERVTRAGYEWRVVAENVASGQSSADEVVQTWLQSPGHCANVMNPDMREMGVAYAFDAASAAGTYWVQVLAVRR